MSSLAPGKSERGIHSRYGKMLQELSAIDMLESTRGELIFLFMLEAQKPRGPAQCIADDGVPQHTAPGIADACVLHDVDRNGH